MSRGFADLWLLTLRALKLAIRQPANDASNVFIPVFFYIVTIGALGAAAERSFGVSDFKGFQLPVAVLQGAASIAAGSGLGMTTDIQSGYFEKLLLTSAPRWSLVISWMLADAIKVMAVTLLIILIALATGAGFETGVPGVIVLMLAAGAFALAYAGIGMAIALKTGSPQAAQAGFILFFPLLFLAPTFAPIDVFSDWLAWVARVNPVTYLLEGMRSLVTGGWDGPALLKGGASILGIAVLTFTLTLLALRGRGR